MRKIAFLLITCATPGFAQLADAPIQDERLDVAHCMATVDTLPASYRGALYDACAQVAQHLCMVRGTETECLEQTAARVAEFYAQVRPTLPDDLTASEFLNRSYQSALGRVDNAFTGDICTNSTAADQANCIYETKTAALADLFRQARRAEVSLTR